MLKRSALPILWAAGLSLAACAGPADEALIAIVGATIYPAPDEPPIADGVVVVRGETISRVGARSEVSIPPGASVLAADGAILTAGFQNSHVHFTEPGWTGSSLASAEELSNLFEKALLGFGFTTVVDTGSNLVQTVALRERIESGEVRGPRILTAGSPLYPEDGIPFYLREALPAEMLAQLPTPASPDEAMAIVADQLDAGADIVKLFVGSWVARGQVLPMPTEIARAAALEAHERGRLVFAHASNIVGLEVALDAEVDVLAHALDDDRGWDETFVSRMRAGDMAMIPTLKLFGGQPYTKFIQLEVRDYVEASGQILFGTDAGFLEDYDPSEEYSLMAGSGMDWRQILAALTTAPGAQFGEADRRGRVASGQVADLVLLAEDPAEDPTAFADVRFTIRNGRLVYERSD